VCVIGSFATATCMVCQNHVDADCIRDDIMNQVDAILFIYLFLLVFNMFSRLQYFSHTLMPFVGRNVCSIINNDFFLYSSITEINLGKVRRLIPSTLQSTIPFCLFFVFNRLLSLSWHKFYYCVFH